MVVVIVVIIVIAAIAGVILLSSTTTTTTPPTTSSYTSASTTSSVPTTSSSSSSSSSSATTSASSSLTPVTFGLSVAITIEYLPEYVAAHGGFWQQQGLNVNLQPFQGDGAHMQAVSSGQVQIGEASYVGELNAISKGVPIKAIAMGLQQADMVLIVSNTSKYTDPSQLKGATIGVTTAGSATDMMFHLLAAHYNFTIGTDIKELTAGGLTSQLAALTTNKTQGFFWTYETGYQLQTSGDARILLFMNTIIPNWAENTIYATNSLISQNPTLVKKVLQGVYNALAYMETNKTYAVQMAEQYMSLSPQAANKTMTEAFASGQFSTDGNFTSQIIGGMNLARTLMLNLNISSSLVPVNQSFTTQFVPITPQNVSPSPSAILPRLFVAATADSKV
ncbi:MAG TPA: ABC transporter substrate-binding protein [Nitrososphaerales archaeon]|nr:ABC transporter substrate-binding protein [Nitrososphaerales archaeon]